MKTKNSSSRPTNHTPGEVRFCNIYQTFPNNFPVKSYRGKTRSDYVHIVGGFNSWIKRTAIWKKDPDLARELSLKGETHWKDQNGVEHRMIVSEMACERNWNIGKKIRTALEIVK